MSEINIVKRVFEEVRKKIPPPQEQVVEQSQKQSLFAKQNDRQATNSIPKSFKVPKPLPSTPVRQKVKLVPPSTFKVPTRVPKTPQPSRASKQNSSKTSAQITPTKSPNKDIETSIKVFLRIRSAINDEESAEFDVDDNVVSTKHAIQDGGEASSNYQEKKFTFTHIFKEDAYQDEVFEKAAWPMLRHFIRGHDGLLFSYGATGSGKTFTVRGTDEKPGLIPRITKTILGMKNPDGYERGIFVSCVEVYNERIHDLLGESKIPLRIGKDSLGNTVVKNVKEVEIHAYSDLTKIMDSIDKSKSLSGTSFNDNSSRSHCVFTLKLITIPLDPRTGQRVDDLSKICSSRLFIVDLAGSERVDPLENSSGLVSEASNINKSMLVLGRCIRAIRDIKNGKRSIQVPYRESKITELFRDFFDPVSQQKTYCSIIVNISQSASQYEDTLSSLQFAAEAVKCEVKDKDDDYDYDDDDLAARKLSFDDDDDDVEKIDAKNTEEACAQLRRQIVDDYMSKLKKIQDLSEIQLEQAKAQAANSAPSSLSELLAQQNKKTTAKKELEEVRREIDRLKISISEKDAHLSSISDKMEQMVLTLKAVMEDTQQKVEQKQTLETHLKRVLEDAKKEQQELLELKRMHNDMMYKIKTDHEKKLSELQARFYDPDQQ